MIKPFKIKKTSPFKPLCVKHVGSKTKRGWTIKSPHAVIWCWFANRSLDKNSLVVMSKYSLRFNTVSILLETAFSLQALWWKASDKARWFICTNHRLSCMAGPALHVWDINYGLEDKLYRAQTLGCTCVWIIWRSFTSPYSWNSSSSIICHHSFHLFPFRLQKSRLKFSSCFSFLRIHLLYYF